MAIVYGQLGAADLTATTLTAVYTVPASKRASVNVTVTNRADTVTSIRIAHIKNDIVGNVAVEDYLLFDLPTTALASNFSPISFTGIIMTAGDVLAVRSSASSVSAQVNGIEDDV